MDYPWPESIDVDHEEVPAARVDVDTTVSQGVYLPLPHLMGWWYAEVPITAACCGIGGYHLLDPVLREGLIAAPEAFV